MRAQITGEVRTIRPSDDGKYVDVAVLQEGAANSVRLWSFADLEGLGAVKIGDTVTAEVYSQAKIGKKSGQPYESVQLRTVAVVNMAGEKLLKVS